jgi:hypothetical protein
MDPSTGEEFVPAGAMSRTSRVAVIRMSRVTLRITSALRMSGPTARDTRRGPHSCTNPAEARKCS